MSSPGRQVIVIDDDPSVRRSLKRLLVTEGHAVEAFASAQEYLVTAPPVDPACVVLDVRMPGLNGLELQQALRDRGREEQIVFITGHGDVPMCAQAMKTGAVDFLTKPFTDDALLDAVARAVDRAAALRMELDARQQKDAARQKALTLLATLTERELEVFRWIIAGSLNKQTAAGLGTSEKTIKVHRGRITGKLGMLAVADMVRLAQQAGVTPVSAEGGRKELAS